MKLERVSDGKVSECPAFVWRYVINGAHEMFSSIEPPEDAYDEGTLMKYVLDNGSDRFAKS